MKISEWKKLLKEIAVKPQEVFSRRANTIEDYAGLDIYPVQKVYSNGDFFDAEEDFKGLRDSDYVVFGDSCFFEPNNSARIQFGNGKVIHVNGFDALEFFHTFPAHFNGSRESAQEYSRAYMDFFLSEFIESPDFLITKEVEKEVLDYATVCVKKLKSTDAKPFKKLRGELFDYLDKVICVLRKDRSKVIKQRRSRRMQPLLGFLKQLAIKSEENGVQYQRLSPTDYMLMLTAMNYSHKSGKPTVICTHDVACGSLVAKANQKRNFKKVRQYTNKLPRNSLEAKLNGKISNKINFCAAHPVWSYTEKRFLLMQYHPDSGYEDPQELRV